MSGGFYLWGGCNKEDWWGQTCRLSQGDWSQGLFLWMVQRNSPFRNLKWIDGTTQKEFVSGTFRSENSKAFCWPNTSSRQIIASAHTWTSARLQLRRNWSFDVSWFLHVSGARALDGLAYRMSLLPRDKPAGYLKVVFKQHLLKINPWISTLCVLEWRLLSMDGATQIPISEFEVNRWHNSKSSCPVLSGPVNSKTAYWPNTSSRQIIASAHTWTSSKLQLGRNWEANPLPCLKVSTWAVQSTW